jgi:ribonuclease E
MRPTVIRLIAGGALGTAFSVALTLPGSVVFPAERPIRQLAAPEAPTATVLHTAPMVERPTKAPAQPRVVVRRVYVPSAGTVLATSAVRNAPPRSKPPQKPVERAPAPVEQPVTPLAAAPAEPVTEPAEEPEPKEDDGPKAEEPKKAKEPKAEKPRKSEKPKKSEKPRKSEKPKQSKKPKAPGSQKKDKPDRKQDRDDQGEDRRNKDEHGGGRGDDSSRG